jgi:1,4-alpha-glucan branching enzyme
MEREPVHRGWHGSDVGFGLTYAFSERFVLPLSHDEVVHGKQSLIAKMPGDAWQKRANLRALLGLMWLHPGKKLLFMGSELGQWEEWNHDRQLDWALAEDPGHAGLLRLVGDLNRVYRQEGALHHSDADPRGFRWLIEGGDETSLFAFVRSSDYGAPPLVAAINMTPVPREGFRLGVPLPGSWTEILNSDAAIYGGGNIGNAGAVESEPVPLHGYDQSFLLTLPPLGAILLRYEGP